MYEIIERNQYGVLVKNTKEKSDCELCEHSKKELLITLCIKKHGCVDYSYYITDQEAAKLEIEKQEQENLGDKLCEFCPLEKKGCYSVDGGYMAGCEGSKCEDAFDIYKEQQLETETDSQKELIDLQIENKQLKERIKELKDKYECNESCPSFGYQCNINELFKDCNKHRN